MSSDPRYGVADKADNSADRVRIKGIRKGLPTTLVSAALVVSGVLYATNGSSAATTPISQSSGRFLSGSVAGTNLDTLAGILGEQAINVGSETTVLNANSLNAELLNNAINLPLGHALQLPGLNILQLGAVGQYAKAVSDGSALGASGAVSDQGGIALGGSTATPADAKLDLSGLGGQAVASTLGNLKLTIGAISAQAKQATGTNGAQSGKYQVADLGLDLTAPFLAQTVAQLNSAISGALTALAASAPQCGPTPNIAVPICFTGISGISNLLGNLTSLSLANGAITASLTNGNIHISLKALLASLGLNLNDLPPNTSLLPYITDALSRIASGVSGLITDLTNKMNTAFGNLGIELAGIPLSGAALSTALAPVISAIQTPLTSAFVSGASQLSSTVLTPLANQLKALLDLIVNVQSASGGKFTETALLIRIGNDLAGGSGLPTGIPTTFPSLSLAAAQAPGAAHAHALGAAQAAPVHAAAHAAPAHAVAARPVVAAPALQAPVSAANSLVALNLATATVGPGTPGTPTTNGSFVSTPAGGTPGPTSSIHVQSGGGLASNPIVVSPIRHDGNRLPMGIALMIAGLAGLAWPRRRAIARVVAHAKR